MQNIIVPSGVPIEDSTVIFIDTEWFAGALYRLASRFFRRSEHPLFFISSLDFFVYDWVATRHCQRLLKQGESWDIVHSVTPVSPLAAMRLTSLGIPERYRNKCRSLLENSVDLELFQTTPWPEAPSDNNPLQIVFVGRLLLFKGVTMLLEAVKASNFGLTEQVEFTGNLPLNEVSNIVKKAHVFCLPSVRGGAVLLEAMAIARPVIAIDFGGSAEIVDDGVGVKLPATGKASVTTTPVWCADFGRLHQFARPRI
ncbi:MAG: glycosyltransferase [Methylococcales bacterium]